MPGSSAPHAIQQSGASTRAVEHLLAYLDARPGRTSLFFESAYQPMADAVVAVDPKVQLFNVDEHHLDELRFHLDKAEKFLCAMNRHYGEGLSETVSTMIEAAIDRSSVAWTISDASDVWGSVFSVSPERITSLNKAIIERCAGADHLRVEDDDGSDIRIALDSGYEWVEIDGFVEARSDLTVNLPPGEVATYSSSVEGSIHFTGGLLGTIPIGRKYGLIADPLVLELVDGRVQSVSTGDETLREDLAFCLSAGEYTDHVCEIGFGTNPAIRQITGLNYTYEEKHYGFHLGFGASLAQQNVERRTNHHLDLLFDNVKVFVDDDILFDGEYRL